MTFRTALIAVGENALHPTLSGRIRPTRAQGRGSL